MPAKSDGAHNIEFNYDWIAYRAESGELVCTGGGYAYRDYKAWRRTIQTLNTVVAKEEKLPKGTRLRVVLTYKKRRMARTIEIGKDWTKE